MNMLEPRSPCFIATAYAKPLTQTITCRWQYGVIAITPYCHLHVCHHPHVWEKVVSLYYVSYFKTFSSY